MMRRACTAALAAIVVGGCGTDLGECDPDAARRIVYDDEGFPAYEGQALIQVSCGNGAFCHSAQATGAARYGAPAELDFDVAIVATEADLARLERGVANVRDYREDILDLVEDGEMPPWGEATETVHRNVPRYRRVADDGTVTRLPFIDSFEGLEILRNWLACDAPVVERTDGAGTVGDVVPVRGL